MTYKIRNEFIVWTFEHLPFVATSFVFFKIAKSRLFVTHFDEDFRNNSSGFLLRSHTKTNTYPLDSLAVLLNISYVSHSPKMS